MSIKHQINIANSVLASTVRRWRGTNASKKDMQLEEALILFDREGCAECRRVRELLTELNLDVLIMPCPLKGKNIKQLRRQSGQDQLPFLVDPNTDAKRQGYVEIARYLYKQYRQSDFEEPEGLAATLDEYSSRFSSLLRLNAGNKAQKSRPAAEPLVLYSFESSPYTRPVRERLCELELPYFLVNIGKQQLADMGPATFRFHTGDYQPLPGSKRERLLKQFGRVQVPFLVDPNTQSEVFESEDILRYLNKHYAL